MAMAAIYLSSLLVVLIGLANGGPRYRGNMLSSPWRSSYNSYNSQPRSRSSNYVVYPDEEGGDVYDENAYPRHDAGDAFFSEPQGVGRRPMMPWQHGGGFHSATKRCYSCRFDVACGDLACIGAGVTHQSCCVGGGYGFSGCCECKRGLYC